MFQGMDRGIFDSNRPELVDTPSWRYIRGDREEEHL